MLFMCFYFCCVYFCYDLVYNELEDINNPGGLFMITQQDLINRLNQLTLRYNLTWNDIKYDADKAIAKINAYLGTNYPPISQVMLNNLSGYSMNASGYRIEIFPDEYFHSVVIPYIAMEVLARDEEFTTIYNKYMAELEDGLFTMFQKEFNRVPMVFRQTNDRGVFFAENTALAKVARNLNENLPTFKFRVYYHVNNSAIVISTLTAAHFLEDNRAYDYREEATIQGYDTTLFSFNGTTAYKFRCWALEPTHGDTTLAPMPDDKIVMTNDLHLYAVWDEESTLVYNTSTGLSINLEYAPSLPYLEIPNYVDGYLVKKISSNFCFYAPNLETIELPAYLETVSVNAFNGFMGSHIIFKETPINSPYPGITLLTNSFSNTPNLTEIILPTNIVAISSGAFPVVTQKQMIIYCRYLLANKPGGWLDDWSASSTDTYSVQVQWGYNG